MRLGSELDLGYLIASVCFLGKDDKGKKVVAVEEPASIKKVQHVKDAVDINSSGR